MLDASMNPNPFSLKRLFGAAALVMMIAAAWACSSSSSGATTFVPLDAQAYCARITGDCNSTNTAVDDCLNSVASIVVPSACNDAIAGAACVDLQNPGSSFGQKCFPARGCVAFDGAFICLPGGIATECFSTDAGAAGGISVDCNASCKAKGKTLDSKCADQCGACNHTCFGDPGDDNCCCQ